MGDQATFSVRNVICEHSQQTPIGDDGGGWKKNKFPVFHVFGATDTGKKACLHVHGVLPYVVVRVGGSLTGGVREAIRGKLNRLIQREIDGGLTSREPGEFVYQLEPFRSRSLYGYCEDEEDFLRVYFSNPWYAQKLVAGLGKEVVGTPLFQAFESHVPFHLQFFMDYSVFGMDMIHMKSVKFRLSTTDSDRDDVYKNLTVKDIREKSELLSPLEKMTSCEIECDGFASDILNAELHKNNMYSSNPGLEYIWRDEISRRTQKGIPIEDLFNEEPSRPHEIFALERDMLRKTKAIARGLRQQSGRDITARLQHTNMSLGRAASAQDWDRELESSPSEFGSQGAEFDDDVAKDENDEEAEDEKDDEDVANEMTMCIPQESSADEDITLQESMDDEETFEDEHQHDDEEESEERNTSYDEMAAQEELDLSFQRVCDDGTNRRKAPADGHLHWVTTWSAFRQKWDVASELAEAAAEKKQVRRLRRSRSKSLAPTCVSSIMSTPSYRHSPTPGPTSQILSQRVDEMKEDESESEIVGLRVASLELFVETKGSMPDPTTDFIKCASLFIANDICRSSTPDFQFVISTFSSQIYCDSRTICAEDELELIREVAKVVVRYDVDILVGYDTERLSWGYLVRRAKFIGLGFDVSRFRRGFSLNYAIGNREVEDFPVQEDEIEPKGRIMVSVWKVVRRELALRNYDRGTATANVLHRKLPLLDDATLTRYCQVPNNLNCQEMFSYLRKLARLNVSLLVEMNWFLQNAEMARVYGIQFKEVWTRGSQLRVESMLLRLARKMNFVAPSVSPLQRSM